MRSPIVLILCRSTSLQDSLTSFLSTTGPAVTLAAATPAAALDILAHRRPDLAIVDTYDQNREVAALVADIRTNWPGTRCLILAESLAQREAAETHGADEVLVWGFPPEQLLRTVQRLTGSPTHEKADQLPGHNNKQ